MHATHEQAPHAGAVRPKRLEQLEHARVVGACFSRQRVTDVAREMPVADGHRVGVGRREVHDVRDCPRSDPAHREQLPPERVVS